MSLGGNVTLSYSEESNNSYFDYDYYYDYYGNFSNVTHYVDPLSPEFKVACFILYSLIFLVGLVGNVLFCYIVISSRSMKTITYHLLVNLSLSDLLITCLCGPLHVIHSLVMGYWPFGSFVCYSFSYFQGISVFVSSFTLVVISFERYMCILHPLKPAIPQGGSVWVISGIWVISLLASIPNPLQTKHEQIQGTWVCTTEMDLTFHISSVVFLVLQYVLPVVLTSYFYAMVAKTIWSRRDICELMDGTSHRANKELQMLRSKRKMIKMLIVVVVCYTVCWLPFNVYWVLGLIVPSLMEGPSFPYVFTIVHILAVSHTCFNPVIYCWMNRRVRYGFMDIVAGIGKLQCVRQCFPNVDWESTRITRHARQTQFTVVRRNGAINRLSHLEDIQLQSRANSFIDGPVGNARNGFTTRSTNNLITSGAVARRAKDPLQQDMARAKSLNLHNMTSFSTSVDVDEMTTNLTSVAASSLAGSLNSGLSRSSSVTSSGHQQPQPRQNSFEMAELIREEPLLQRVHQQRLKKKMSRTGQKISTTSTNITDCSDPSLDDLIVESHAATNANEAAAGPAVNKVDVGTDPIKGGKLGRFLRRSQAIKSKSESLDSCDQVTTRGKRNTNSSGPGTPEEASIALISNPHDQPKLTRSLSEEIAESCFTNVNIMKKANNKEDERYN